MKEYFAAALAIGVAIGPASALDAGIGGKVGGLGDGAGASVGSQGGSVGVGTNVGGAGGANVGASVGVGNGSPAAGVGASGNVGNPSGSVSRGIGLGNAPPAENGSATAPGKPAAAKPAAATTATASAKAARQSNFLPPILRPSKAGEGEPTPGYPLRSLEPVTAKPGKPTAIARACRAAIMSAAKPLGAVRVNAVSAGALHHRGGVLTAPIKVRIDYARQGGIEVRQAQVSCRLNKAGRVTAVI
ncbi:hypothetical protein FJ934_19625 [Mesorhizobium sp. B2-4-12]|uniref:hypothetical protein n=1 Tax=Mesorhizobium sp. B2-4-12 TaxID=2589937 RepID=UPI001126E5EF|nr:hypothetical protein [Mesorhizobium sp. B2-4-12]TPK93037.1 hypothetical protein FJ934_19625 [Mesorhizobium sp. B2-4-12]